MPGAKIDLTKSTPRDIDPYDYQREAIARLDAYYAPDRNTPTKYRSGVLVMPTGSGKTFTSVSWLLDKAVGAGYQLIWLVHRQELVRQACETLVEMSPVLKNYGFDKIRIVPVSSSDSGISQAVGADIIVGCIQSFANKNGLKYLGLITKGKGRSRLAVVIDEAHHASSDSYRLVLKRLEQYNPDYMLLGMTATPTRMVEAEKRRFQQLFSISDNVKNHIGTPRGFIYEVTLKDLIKRGALANPVYRRVETQINGEVEFDFTDADRKHLERFGELSEKVKQKVADSSRRNRIIVDEYMKNRDKYGKTVIFAVNQLHCRTLQQAFADAGISNDRCRYAISDEKKQADINIAAFKNDEFPILINVRMLTEGFDSPNIQTCFLTRFTQSASLKMQMAGRALRGVKSKGTKFAYIVDFHDMWEGIDTDWGGIIEGERFVTCPQCGSRRNADEDIVCPFCGADIKPVKTPAEPAERVHIPPEVYIRIYGAMRDNLMHNTHNDVVPVGWYTIPDDEGMERVILVYDHQLYGYKRLERDIETKGRPDQTAAFYIGSPSYFSDETLTEQTWPPDETDLTLFIEYAKAAGQIPLFYTFEQRDALDPYQIAEELGTQDFGGNFLEQSRKANAWLLNRHANTPILRDLYRNPDDFVRAVNGIISDNKEEKAKIEYYDNRDPYIIEPGVYDLNLLRDEVISDIRAAGVKDSDGQPLFANAVRPDLVWSGRIMKSYFGICCKRGTPDDIRYFIRINKIMSSPQAPRETLKFLIWHELLHANLSWNHNGNFRDTEWKYPDAAAHNSFLDSLRQRFRIVDTDLPMYDTAPQIPKPAPAAKSRHTPKPAPAAVKPQAPKTKPDSRYIAFTSRRTYQITDKQTAESGDYICAAPLPANPGKYFMLFAYGDGRFAKIALAGYNMHSGRSVLKNAYSGHAPLVWLRMFDADRDLAVFSSINKVMVFNTSLINPIQSTSGMGVTVLKSKDNSTLSRVELLENAGLTDPEYYRRNTIPATGYKLKKQ